MWISYNKGESIGTIGSENGKIIFDEVYSECSRITVEECKRYYAITVELYGSMVHTVYCDKYIYMNMFSDMKKDIEEFYSINRTMEEESKFCDEFYDKY